MTTEQLTVFPEDFKPVPYLPNEKSKHIAAFDLYCRMLDKRNLRGLAKLIGVNENTVMLWSTKFKWAERIVQFEKELSRMILELEKDSIIEHRRKHIAMIDQAIKQWKDKLDAGEVSLSLVQDIEKLLNIRAKLTGQEAVTTEQNISVNINFG